MTKKEIIKLVAKEYVKQYKREIGVYDALKTFGIYVDIEESLKEAYLEHILDSVSSDFAPALCDFAAYGFVDLKLNRFSSSLETITDLDRLVDIYLEDMEEE